MRKSAIEIVDRGRGLQLSTSRVTVQDLVPYFQDGCSTAEIIEAIPILTVEEVAVVENYYRAHKAELDAEDQRIRERTEERMREQQRRLPQLNGDEKTRMARLQNLLHKRRQQKNGQGTSG